MFARGWFWMHVRCTHTTYHGKHDARCISGIRLVLDRKSPWRRATLSVSIYRSCIIMSQQILQRSFSKHSSFFFFNPSLVLIYLNTSLPSNKVFPSHHAIANNNLSTPQTYPIPGIVSPMSSFQHPPQPSSNRLLNRSYIRTPPSATTSIPQHISSPSAAQPNTPPPPSRNPLPA